MSDLNLRIKICLKLVLLSEYEREEHDNPADFFLDIIMQCEIELKQQSGACIYNVTVYNIIRDYWYIYIIIHSKLLFFC